MRKLRPAVLALIATTALAQAPQTIDTRIGPLEFTHGFADGYPTDATLDKLYDERDFQRACQAYLWALPAVAFTAWQRGLTKGLGAKNGQIVAILSYEARRGILTANATTPYYLGFADLSAGPLVLEMPAQGVQGGINDAWQQALPDAEKPGKYLVLGPGQKAPDDTAGYIVRRSPTVNIFLGVRLTDPDPQRAKGRCRTCGCIRTRNAAIRHRWKFSTAGRKNGAVCHHGEWSIGGGLTM
jgi:hypothetical protein